MILGENEAGSSALKLSVDPRGTVNRGWGSLWGLLLIPSLSALHSLEMTSELSTYLGWLGEGAETAILLGF